MRCTNASALNALHHLIAHQLGADALSHHRTTAIASHHVSNIQSQCWRIWQFEILNLRCHPKFILRKRHHLVSVQTGNQGLLLNMPP